MATIEKNNAEAIVDAYVKQNGNNEITGDIMNTVMKTLIGYALRGLHFLGVVDSNTSFPTNTPFFGLAIGADTIEGVTIPANALACVYNNGETGDTNQVDIILSADALISAHNTSNTSHSDIRTAITDGLADLQDEIDALSASSDVTDVVGTYTDLQNYDTSGLTANDIVKVLEDSTHDDSTTYYRWILVGSVGQWQFIGEQGAYYTKAQADAKFVEKEAGKGLSSNDFTNSFKTAVENLYNLLRITGSADNGTYLTTLDNIKGIIGIGNRVNYSYLEFLAAVTKLESSVPLQLSTPTAYIELFASVLSQAKLKLASGSAELSQKDANDQTKAYIGLFANSLASLMFANGVNFNDGGANKQLNTTFGDITLQSTTGNVDLKSGAGKVRIYGQTGGVQIEGNSGDVDVNTGTGKKMNYNGNEVATFADIVQSDWEQANSAQPDFIKNKPSIKAGTGNNSIREGGVNTASGICSHAEGAGTTASGDESHTEGEGTIANHRAQHVFGEYNVADTNAAAADQRGDFVEIVGNGTYLYNRSNARTLDWQGNEVLAGGLKINGTHDVAVINPATSAATTLVAGKLNTLGTVDYSTIALPATPGTAEYNGTFTSTTSGDITVSLPLNFWQGDTDIVAGKTYSFSIQNGVGFIIQLD